MVADHQAPAGPSLPRRSLAAALREARSRAKISLVDAADHINVSDQTLRRMELGKTSSVPEKVEKLCRLYELPPELSAVLVELARESRAKGWWANYGDLVPGWLELYLALEATAWRLRTFSPLLMPGLLQIPEYMRAAILTGFPEATEDEVQARLALRQRRQQILTRAVPVEVEFIIAESVLLAEPGDGIMFEQLWAVRKAAEQPGVTVRILRSTVSPHAASDAGSFTILDLQTKVAPSPTTIYSENLTGAIYLDKPHEVAAYERVWVALQRAAEDITTSKTIIEERLKVLNERER